MEPEEAREGQSSVESDLQTREAPFVRQVEDRTLPASQILNEQRAHLGPDMPIQAFVP